MKIHDLSTAVHSFKIHHNEISTIVRTTTQA